MNSQKRSQRRSLATPEKPQTPPEPAVEEVVLPERKQTQTSQFRQLLMTESKPAAELNSSKANEDAQWLAALAGTGAWDKTHPQLERYRTQEINRLTTTMTCVLYELLATFADQFNSEVGTAMKIGASDPAEVTEKKKVKRNTGISVVEQVEEITWMRWRISTRTWSISCRARLGSIEVFVIPTQDIMLLSDAEIEIRRRLKLDLAPNARSDTAGGAAAEWLMDGMPIGADEVRVAIKQAFRELVRNTQEHQQPIASQKNNNAGGDETLTRLYQERQNLAHKVVIQQEEIQKRIARDLHDAVISDVMALKRSLAASKVSNDEAVKALDVIAVTLREICYDLSPRDLGDWGLSTVIEDMLETISQRTGADCTLNFDIELPHLASAVELHIYRIVQESLNNVEKYAEATRIGVTFEMENDILTVLVADNGKGFTPGEAVSADQLGGVGMGSLRERTDLIKCFYPATIEIDSKPGKGTRTTLTVDLSGGKAKSTWSSFQR